MGLGALKALRGEGPRQEVRIKKRRKSQKQSSRAGPGAGALGPAGKTESSELRSGEVPAEESSRPH